ncbi:MAG: hypothetical protein HC799_03210 [Limnothrix sp. RL_2_0]|nr:hypothetical protein [Limnothrix sp. RL_2_0]
MAPKNGCFIWLAVGLAIAYVFAIISKNQVLTVGCIKKNEGDLKEFQATDFTIYRAVCFVNNSLCLLRNPAIAIVNNRK